MESIPEGGKRCRKCQEVKQLTDFHRQKRVKDGRQSYCKACRRQYYLHNADTEKKRAAEWLKNNPERARETARKWRTKNKVKLTAQRRAWRAKNQEQLKANQRKYYLQNAEYMRRKTREWSKANPDRVRAYRIQYYKKNSKAVKAKVRKWRDENPHKATLCDARKKAIRASRLDTLTPEQWQACLEYWKQRCAVCGTTESFFVQIVPDHWIPLCRDDTPGNVMDNIIPLCHSKPGGFGGCNNTKQARDPLEWLEIYLGKEQAKTKFIEVLAYFEWVQYRLA